MPLLTRRQTLQGGLAAAMLTAGPQTAEAAPDVRPAAETIGLKLRILETTDLHVNIVPYDYYRDAPDDTVGLAKTASLVRGAQAEVRNSILFDNGDLIQGSPLGDYVAYRKGMKPGDVHPMIAAMNVLPYACSTLGNHEFNYGLDVLGKALSTAKFPIVCANAIKPDGQPLMRPWVMIERDFIDDAGQTQRLRIGVIGLLPPQIMQWDKANLDGRLTTLDIVDAAQHHVPDIRRAGADLVVALCHSGIAGGERQGGEENAALHLATVEGIDVILTGHQHLVFPGPDFANIAGVDAQRGTLHGKPAVMAGFWGSHLGLIDLDLEKRPEGWRIAAFNCEARPIFARIEHQVVPKASAEPAVLAAVKSDHEATLAYVRQPVGSTAVPIQSYFALVADSASIKIITEAQSWYVATLLRQTPFKDLPLLSAAAPFKAGGRGGPTYFTDIKPGPIAIKDLADIYIYPNTVRAVRVTGTELRGWLERSAGLYNRIDPARAGEQPLIDPKVPAFNFDVIAGVTYRIDPVQPSRYDPEGTLVAPDARRIVDLAYDGKPVADDQVFIVATNNYRAGGGGKFPGNDGSTIVLDAPDLTRDVIMRYVMAQKEIAPEPDGSWSLVLPGGPAILTMLTGPGAGTAQPHGIAAEPMGEAPGGFVKYRLSAAG